MPYLKWDEALSVGNDEIDGQHRTFINMVNDLHAHLVSDSASTLGKTTEHTLENLDEYIRAHFSFEEEYMKNIHYRGLDDHRRLHEEFADRVRRHRQDIRRGSVVLNSQLMKELLNWFTEHIVSEDMKYTLPAR